MTAKKRGGPRPGSGRKPKGDRPRVQISVTVHPETLAEIDRRKAGGSRGEVIDGWANESKEPKEGRTTLVVYRSGQDEEKQAVAVCSTRDLAFQLIETERQLAKKGGRACTLWAEEVKALC